MRHRLKVLGIAATDVSAKVIDIMPVRDLALPKTERYPMRTFLAPIQLELTIPSGVCAGFPGPALFRPRNINLRPETLHASWYYRSSSHPRPPMNVLVPESVCTASTISSVVPSMSVPSASTDARSP